MGALHPCATPDQRVRVPRLTNGELPDSHLRRRFDRMAPAPQEPQWTRRQALNRCGMGFGILGLAGVLDSAGLLAPSARAAAINPLAPRPPHFAGRARRVVHLFMNGGPSQVDTFDPKPLLGKYHGRPLPRTNLRTERKTGAAMRS